MLVSERTRTWPTTIVSFFRLVEGEDHANRHLIGFNGKVGLRQHQHVARETEVSTIKPSRNDEKLCQGQASSSIAKMCKNSYPRRNGI